MSVEPHGRTSLHFVDRVSQPRRSPQDKCRPRGSPANCTDAGGVCLMLDTKASSPRSGVDVVKENKCIGQHAVQILYKIYYVYMKHMDEHLRAGQNKIRTCEKYSSAR